MAAELRVDYEDYFAANYQQTVSDNAAPKKKEQERFVKVEKTLLTKQDKRLHRRKLMLACTAFAVVFVLSVLNCAAYVAVSDAGHEIAQLEKDLELKKSEYIQLNSELEALVSPEKVEKIAVEQLGLIKLNDSDWQYINIDKGNQIIVSQGNTAN